MFGFIIGTLCFIGLVKVVRHGHHGYGHHGYGGGRRWMLRRLFYRLDTTPGQEKVILEAIDNLQAQRSKVWAELQQTKADIAAAVSGETFDEAKVRTAFERHDALLTELRTAATEELRKVHEALRPEQRALVSELFRNPYGFTHGGGHGGCGGWRRSSCGGRGGYGREYGPSTVNL